MRGSLRRSALTGSPLSSALAQWTQPGFVRSIQRATITITGATSATSTITAVDISNAELHYLGRTYNNNAGTCDQALVRLTFTNPTTITASVITSPGADILTVSFEVIEYVPGVIKSIQRGTITQAAGTATILPVNLLKSHLDFLGNTSTVGAPLIDVDGKMVLTNATTVTYSVGAAGTQVGGYQVVEFY